MLIQYSGVIHDFISMRNYHFLASKYWIFLFISFILTLLLAIPIRLEIAKIQAPQPQAFFILGGGPEREQLTAELARWYPSLDIWISSGSSPDKIRNIFQAAGVSLTRIHMDYRAIDTVTNFTTLVNDFKHNNIKHLYLITSDFHMPRAKAIATIVLGSQGIAFTPVSVQPLEPPPEETWLHIVRDSGRALLWVVSGYTGVEFKNALINFSLFSILLAPFEINCMGNN